MTTSPREHYRAGRDAAAREASALEGRVLRASGARVVAFLLAAGGFLLLETSPRAFWPYLIGFGTLGILAFVWMVRRHARLGAALERARLTETLHQEALARMDRAWDDAPFPFLEEAPETHPSAGDLDLLGHASLVHLIGRVRTAPGRAILRQLVLDPFASLPGTGADLLDRLHAPAPEPSLVPYPGWRTHLERRQDAVRALAPETAFRERLVLLSREAGGGGASADTRRFLRWLDQPDWLADHRIVRTLGRLLAIVTPATILTWLVGWTPGAVPVLFMLCSLGLQRVVGGALAERAGAADAGEGDLRRWFRILEHLERLPSGAALLDELGEGIRQPSPGAARALRSLLRISDTANIRRSSLAHFPLVAVFSWDVHMLDLLERWQRRHGRAAGGWIRSMGEVEVLCALGGLLHDHPDWIFPEFVDAGEPGIEARALGHPLLEPARCVTNDVQVPASGRLLLVTGSNMAGKTTLLRALGANQVLGLAGAPVSAEIFRTRALLPWTAMRVHDSLEGGVSYFLAELNRLRRVVEAARTAPTLYLLDEILQGTNSEERRVAARIVLGHLLATGAVGAVTTHDLALADSEHLRARSVNVHFREEVVETEDGRVLDFDYRLRPGPATSRNALLLLEMVGLGPDGS